MLHDHIKVIKWSLNFMARLHCFPIIWDKDKIKFKKNLFFTRFFEIVQILYFVLILYVILIQVHADCGVQILFSLQVGLGLTMIYLWGMGVQLAKIGGTLLNTISAFEIWLKHNFGGIFSNMERTRRNTFLRRVLSFANGLCPAVGILRMRRLANNSCNPIFLGYAIGYCAPCGEQVSNYGVETLKLIKLGVIVPDGLNVTVEVFKSMLLNFLKILFPSISTGPTRISLSSRIELYRCLEIVGKELNHFGSSRIVPAVLIVCPMVQIFYTFVLIKFYKTQSVGGIITYCTVVILCVLASMAFDTFASQIGVKSDQRRKEWGKERGLKKVERKILTSLQPIRIRIGSNFVDRDTALMEISIDNFHLSGVRVTNEDTDQSSDFSEGLKFSS
ncbi:Cytochrome bo(3) ubiquinol oxidase subunit 1 [Folsomia candida]|uniref:Cytochrome bo(3) ubiquinol oxidase subunit 1 n=1 Tax=Folsomia candida TaxID=158441 RepID=A0A226D4L6_FOLCA|nr:Cytochrome bo(3) ubiquinol oxidase subunit 1 [Folsomia candida]